MKKTLVQDVRAEAARVVPMSAAQWQEARRIAEEALQAAITDMEDSSNLPWFVLQIAACEVVASPAFRQWARNELATLGEVCADMAKATDR